MRRRKAHPKQRGFALLVVVLIVALIGVAAVALLDIVNVDLIIAGQHRQTVDAQAIALGAMYEVISDSRVDGTVLPRPDTVGLKYDYAQAQAGGFVRDPGGLSATGMTAMNPANSAYVRNTGTSVAEGYAADISLLRLAPQLDSAVDLRAAVYEVTVESTVSNGAATHQVRTIVSRMVGGLGGRQLTQEHAR